MFHHLAHLDGFKAFVKKGVKVTKGDIIANVGKTGTKYAHLHYETRVMKPPTWTSYIWGMTQEDVKRMYPDPTKYIDRERKIPAPYDTFGGYEYLDPINTRGTAFHPGIDLNEGFGDQDLGNPVRSPCNGEIVYLEKDEGGWGNHLWILEDFESEVDEVFAKEQAGKIFLQVEEHGEAWYVDTDGRRHYMGSTPAEMLEFVQKMSIGITNDNLNKIPKA